jgi:zinc D-Ala-D-Ala carboxypeptidase
MSMGNLSEHFSVEEFACPCCKVNKCGADLINALERVRVGYGKPLVINSGYRCMKHNVEIGGAARSKHLEGIAVDIRAFSGAEKYELIRLGILFGFKGIGVANSFVHLDLRSEACVWKY